MRIDKFGMKRRQFVCAGVSLAPALLLPGCGSPGRSISAAGGYVGMEEGVPWRQQALARIEKYRKGDFKLRVTDQRGRPLPGARIRGKLHRHHFGFGAAVSPRKLYAKSTPPKQREQYLEHIRRSFHKVTIANGLKWKHYDANRKSTERFLDWCEAEQLPVRGHCLVWPKFQRIPPQLAVLKDDPQGLRSAIEEHIARMAARYGGPVMEWDVLNEPWTHREFEEILGKEVAIDWFRLTERANPTVKRYINDYAILMRDNPRHRQGYFDYIRWLLDNGAPVQGIGFQCHIPEGFSPTPPEELYRRIQQFAEFGLDMQATEFDYETKDADLQARYTRDFLITIFSHPGMVGLITWTPFEYLSGAVSKPDAVMWNVRLKAKPNGRIWDRMINGEWKTRVGLRTDEEGIALFRGFKGKYQLEVSAGRVGRSVQVELIEDSGTAEISI